jgi:hypothetical protein
MEIVVINYNQQEYVEPMCKSLYPYNPLFVFDRCEPVKGCRVVHNKEGSGFLAGRMRDLGAREILKEDILFLDGDKIPKGDIITDINRLNSKYDCILYSTEDETLSPHASRQFVNSTLSDDIVPFQKQGIPFSTGSYSCGMWLSAKAIRVLRNLNNGRIFNEEFDGYWGDEDNFVADCLNYSGLKIGYSNSVRLSGKIGGIDSLEKQSQFQRNFIKRIQLRKLMFNAPA